MKRKVSQIGPATLMVSLPSKWVKENNVIKGDELDIEMDGKSLLIGVTSSKEYNMVEVNLQGNKVFLKRYLTSLYKNGIDKIKYTFDSRTMLSDIEKQVSDLIGIEIIEQGENFCVVSSIANPLEEQFDNLLKRIFLTVAMMFKEIISSVEKQDFANFRDAANLEKTINKLSIFCIRLLNKGYNSQKSANSLISLIGHLEQVGDNLSDICLETDNISRISEKAVDSVAKTLSLYEDIQKLYFRANLKDIELYKSKRQKTHELQKKCFNDAKGEERMILHYILAINDTLHRIEELLLDFVWKEEMKR